VCIIANFASLAARGPATTSYSSVQTGVMVIDLATLAAFTAVALTSDRFWPLWISGLQLTTSMGHLMKGIHSDLLPLAYAAALRFWSYPNPADPRHRGLAPSSAAPPANASNACLVGLGRRCR